MLQTMAEHPALCTRLMGGMSSELTGAQLMAEVDRVIMAPVRDLLSEAAEDGELIVHDPSVASLILMGSVSTAALVRTLSGDYDPEATADQLIPQLLDGFRPR